MSDSDNFPDFDAVVIGAGFAGLGMLRRLREEHGMSVQVYETGAGVGGTESVPVSGHMSGRWAGYRQGPSGTQEGHTR